MQPTDGTLEQVIRSHYGADLLPYPADLLDALGFEPTTWAFLHTCGLPAQIADGTELIITTSRHLVALGERSDELSLCLFGESEFGEWVCERQTGHVYLLDEGVAHFINSHIAALLIFCALYRTMHIDQPYARESPSIYRKRAADLRAAFRAYDPRAATRSVLWVVRLEEVRNGII